MTSKHIHYHLIVIFRACTVARYHIHFTIEHLHDCCFVFTFDLLYVLTHRINGSVVIRLKMFIL